MLKIVCCYIEMIEYMLSTRPLFQTQISYAVGCVYSTNLNYFLLVVTITRFRIVECDNVSMSLHFYIVSLPLVTWSKEHKLRYFIHSASVNCCNSIQILCTKPDYFNEAKYNTNLIFVEFDGMIVFCKHVITKLSLFTIPGGNIMLFATDR